MMKRTARLILVTSLAGCLVLTVGHAQYYPNRQAVNPYTGKPLATQAVNPYTGKPASPPGVRNPYTGNVTPAPSGYNPLTGKMQPGLGNQPPAGGGSGQWPPGRRARHREGGRRAGAVRPGDARHPEPARDARGGAGHRPQRQAH